MIRIRRRKEEKATYISKLHDGACIYMKLWTQKTFYIIFKIYIILYIIKYNIKDSILLLKTKQRYIFVT